MESQSRSILLKSSDLANPPRLSLVPEDYYDSHYFDLSKHNDQIGVLYGIDKKDFQKIDATGEEFIFLNFIEDPESKKELLEKTKPSLISPAFLNQSLHYDILEDSRLIEEIVGYQQFDSDLFLLRYEFNDPNRNNCSELLFAPGLAKSPIFADNSIRFSDSVVYDIKTSSLGDYIRATDDEMFKGQVSFTRVGDARFLRKDVEARKIGTRIEFSPVIFYK